MSLTRTIFSSTVLGFAALLLAALPVGAQYPGQVAKSTKANPELRAIAVLEWTGEAGNPKASRLVPVVVLDGTRLEGDQLQDGGIYLSRPEPLALAGEVEYELEQNGKPLGLFDIRNSGREQGSWVAYGAWKPLPAPKAKPSMDEVARSTMDDQDSDRPTLHRKNHGETSPTGTGTSGGGSTAPTSAKDPAPASDPAPTPDPDRPTLHKHDTSSKTADANKPATTSGSPPDDPDRPVMKNSKKKPVDLSHVESLPEVTDPDRPRLKRGKGTGNGLDVLPTLMGMPADMQQTVAVSDTKSRPEHPWSYSWANTDDEAKMKSALEEIARNALSPPPPSQPKPAPRRTAVHKHAKPAPPPDPLAGEQFRVFELAYGSGATMVLTAHTDGPFAQQKFITLVAQPDLYGNVLVLLKNVTDAAHLDETPRMRLIDAVDAMADNRGELLFELRGATQRQFALYRVLRGRAEKLFVTGGGEFAAESKN